MSLTSLLLVYSGMSLPLLVFLFYQVTSLRAQCTELRFSNEGLLEVKRFFKVIHAVLKRWTPILDELKSDQGRPPTDYRFQLRWMLWWKVFGPTKLSDALDQFNKSRLLQQLLGAPPENYTRWKVRYFLTKLTPDMLGRFSLDLVDILDQAQLIDWKEAVMDSFPVKSPLSTVKCLTSPKVEIPQVIQFLREINLTHAIELASQVARKVEAIETKLKALLVKCLWDLPSWPKVHELFTQNDEFYQSTVLPCQYKTPTSLKEAESILKRHPESARLEASLVVAAVATVKALGLRKTYWRPKSLDDLCTCFHHPHRFKDPGISLSYCASKNWTFFGRGGLVIALKSLELPLLVTLTPCYKQGTESVLLVLELLVQRYGERLQGVTFYTDSEFGTEEVRKAITRLFAGRLIAPDYGTKIVPSEVKSIYYQSRSLNERVISNLVRNWDVEQPPFLGPTYAAFHLGLANVCDLLQVYFNFTIGAGATPHAIKTIKG